MNLPVQKFASAIKMIISFNLEKNQMCLLKIMFVGTRKNRHSLCFGAKIRTIVIPLQTPDLFNKSGV